MTDTIPATRTRVVHRRRERFDVLIDRTTPWGNPYSAKPSTLARFRVGTDAEAIAGFNGWARTSSEPRAAWIRAHLDEVLGKVLGCWCAPLGGVTADDPLVCHGQILARMAAEAVRSGATVSEQVESTQERDGTAPQAPGR
jgi:hypothetical protein